MILHALAQHAPSVSAPALSAAAVHAPVDEAQPDGAAQAPAAQAVRPRADAGPGRVPLEAGRLAARVAAVTLVVTGAVGLVAPGAASAEEEVPSVSAAAEPASAAFSNTNSSVTMSGENSIWLW